MYLTFEQNIILCMQDTKIFDLTSAYFTASGSLFAFLFSILKKARLTAVFSDCRATYLRKDLVRLLIISKFLEFKSVRALLTSDLSKIFDFGKDVIYELKNNYYTNWRKILWEQSIECINEVDHIDVKARAAHQIPCLIADDSDLPKRGHFFEMIGKIFSHKDRKYIWGFKSHNLFLWTGKTSFGLDFTIHVEKRKDGKQGLTNEQLSRRFAKDRPKGCHTNKRLKECLDKKTDRLIAMLRSALKKGVQARYLLVDSWFFNSGLVRFISSTKLDLISRPKKNNWLYTYKETDYTIGKLLNKFKSHSSKKRSRKLKMHYVTVQVTFKRQALNVYFYKATKGESDWQILISTHIALSAIKAYEIYKNRWSIEVAYKILKQQFSYGKSQSRDFGAQIADHTISLMAYNYMSLNKCKNDYESIEALFKTMKQNWIRPTVMEKFWKMLYSFALKLANKFGRTVDFILNLMMEDDEFVKLFNPKLMLTTTET